MTDSVRSELTLGLAGLDPTTLDMIDLPTVGRPTPTRSPAVAEMVAAVVVGDAAPRPILSRCTLGRATAGDGGILELTTTDPLVSRRHLEIWPDGEAVLCRDLGSRNGTVRVRDGVRHVVATTSATTLVPGDVLVTADDAVVLRVVDPP